MISLPMQIYLIKAKWVTKGKKYTYRNSTERTLQKLSCIWTAEYFFGSVSNNFQTADPRLEGGGGKLEHA